MIETLLQVILSEDAGDSPLVGFSCSFRKAPFLFSYSVIYSFPDTMEGLGAMDQVFGKLVRIPMSAFQEGGSIPLVP